MKRGIISVIAVAIVAAAGFLVLVAWSAARQKKRRATSSSAAAAEGFTGEELGADSDRLLTQTGEQAVDDACVLGGHRFSTPLLRRNPHAVVEGDSCVAVPDQSLLIARQAPSYNRTLSRGLSCKATALDGAPRTHAALPFQPLADPASPLRLEPASRIVGAVHRCVVVPNTSDANQMRQADLAIETARAMKNPRVDRVVRDLDFNLRKCEVDLDHNKRALAAEQRTTNSLRGELATERSETANLRNVAANLRSALSIAQQQVSANARAAEAAASRELSARNEAAAANAMLAARPPSGGGAGCGAPRRPPRADARCGPEFGNAECGPGWCCSQWGWCGQTPAHCGKNENSCFNGQPRAPPPPPPPPPTTGCGAPRRPPRADARCGPEFGNAECGPGWCCSQWGWCGKTSAHCVDNPNACFNGGDCGKGFAPPRSDARCGPQFGNARCGRGSCCSPFGWCGQGAAWCNDNANKCFDGV